MESLEGRGWKERWGEGGKSGDRRGQEGWGFRGKPPPSGGIAPGRLAGRDGLPGLPAGDVCGDVGDAAPLRSGKLADAVGLWNRRMRCGFR